MNSNSNDSTESEAQIDNNLHRVVSTDELGKGERVLVDVEEMEIGVFNIDGEFFAVANYCVHQGGPVCEGLLAGEVAETMDGELTYAREDEILSCPWHGWEFDVKSGEHRARPEYGIPTYDVVVRDGDVYISF